MKVFTIDQSCELTIFKNTTEFLKSCNDKGWCDPKYMIVANTNDIKEFYCEPYVKGMIVHTEKEIKAHNMLHDEFKRIS